MDLGFKKEIEDEIENERVSNVEKFFYFFYLIASTVAMVALTKLAMRKMFPCKAPNFTEIGRWIEGCGMLEGRM